MISRTNVATLRLILAIASVSFLLFLILETAKFGYSRLLTRYALLTNSGSAANAAINLTPSDPDARRALATILSRVHLLAEANRELEIATSLRPADDYMWLELGQVKDELGDTQGANTAFEQAVTHAPYYAHTLWQRGNLLLRLGRYDEGFVDLRRAADSNKAFLPSLIDLAWSLSHGNPDTTEQLVRIDNDYKRVLYTRFLAKKGIAEETLKQFENSASAFTDENRKDLIRQLIHNQAYREAYEIWKVTSGVDNHPLPFIYDGGFEGPLTFDEVGFGWYVMRAQTKADTVIDATDRESGAKSLRITFNGDSNPLLAVVSQTILIKPGQQYQINFAVKTKDVVTGGLPYLSAVDSASGQLLGRSINFPEASNGWQSVSFKLTTLPTSKALTISVQRNGCNSSPCPIFGVVALDSFSIEES